MSKVKEFVSYVVFESFPFVEYIADALLNWNLTKKFINHSNKADDLKERLRLFVTVTIRSFLYIFVTSLIFSKLIKPLAAALFNDCNLPVWIYPFCIFTAWKSFNNICDEIS